MKYQLLRKLATARQWANTERGEQLVTKILTSMFFVAVILVILIIAG